MNLERELRYMEYVQRETGTRHQSLEEDLLPYELLKAGDMRAADAMKEPERANTASDLFIRQADTMTDIQKILELQYDMVVFFTKEVASLDKKSVYSRNVTRALDYIYNHLHEPITVDDVAREVGVSRGYFSTLFKKEMGIGVAEYIVKKRMEAARNMLRYSDMSYAEISEILAFSSQSHFTAVFKKHHGITPKEYRMRG